MRQLDIVKKYIIIVTDANFKSADLDSDMDIVKFNVVAPTLMKKFLTQRIRACQLTSSAKKITNNRKNSQKRLKDNVNETLINRVIAGKKKKKIQFLMVIFIEQLLNSNCKITC